MLKKPKNKQKTVAEKVAELISHPNESGSDSESGADEARARVIDFDEDEYQMPDARTTDIRKRNIKMLSEQSSRYKGKIASRKDFDFGEDDAQESDEEGEESDGDGEESDDNDKPESDDNDEPESDGNETSESDENEEALKAFSRALKTKQTKHGQKDDESDQMEDDSEEQDDVDDDDSDDEEQDVEGDDSEDNEEGDTDDENEENEPEVISKVNRDAEIQKGLCVQNQLHVWERLLELRINSQKIVTKANQLPEPNEVKALQSSNEKSKTIAQETTKQVQNLLQSLLTLQDTLFSQYSELNKSLKPSLKRPSPFKQHNVNEGPPLKQVNTYLQERFEGMRTYRNTVLLKWDDRTKLLQPGAGAKKKSMNEEFDIIKKIDNTLMNKSLLIEKSQQLKNTQQPESKEDASETQEEDRRDFNRNVYDDSEFYHQQLRELIEYKANTSNNMSEVTKQFLELQKLRQKMKKKVDTRASKGRKLRYVVHNKLINYMAPHDNSTWTNESKDELSKSLFV